MYINKVKFWDNFLKKFKMRGSMRVEFPVIKKYLYNKNSQGQTCKVNQIEPILNQIDPLKKFNLVGFMHKSLQIYNLIISYILNYNRFD